MIVITKRISVLVIIIREDNYNSLFDQDKRKEMILKKKRHVLTKRKEMILKKEKKKGSPSSAYNIQYKREERKKEVVAMKVERGFSRESRRRRERKKERKMPRSSVLGVADDTGRRCPLRGTLLYNKNASAERSGQ